MHLLLTKLTSA